MSAGQQTPGHHNPNHTADETHHALFSHHQIASTTEDLRLENTGRCHIFKMPCDGAARGL